MTEAKPERVGGIVGLMLIAAWIGRVIAPWALLASVVGWFAWAVYGACAASWREREQRYQDAIDCEQSGGVLLYDAAGRQVCFKAVAK